MQDQVSFRPRIYLISMRVVTLVPLPVALFKATGSHTEFAASGKDTTVTVLNLCLCLEVTREFSLC